MLFFEKDRGCFTCEVDRVVTTEGERKRVRVRKRLPKGLTQQQAEVMAEKIEADLIYRRTARVGLKGWAEHVAELGKEKNGWIQRAVTTARNRAKAREWRFTLTHEDVVDLLVESGGRCMVTGARFSLEPAVGKKGRPLMYSLDRVDSDAGYTKANCRIVCFATNIAMLHWGAEAFGELAMAYTFNRFCGAEFLRQRRE